MTAIDTTTQTIGKPVPVPDEMTAPFWEAARQHRLVIQQCSDCETFHHPPVGICSQCLSIDLQFVDVSGRGYVYSYSIVRDQRLPAFDDLMPYIVAEVRLHDAPGVRLLSNLPGTAIDDVHCGMEVEVDFEEIAPDVVIPQFRKAAF